MKLQVVLAGAVVIALAAGAAQAATHKGSGKSAGAYAEPAQPIAYAKVDSYLKASGHARTTQSWGLDATGMAAGSATAAGANASATAPVGGDMTQPSAGAAPSAAPADQGAAAPAPSAAAPNPPATETSPPSTQAPPPGDTGQPK